MEIFIPTSTTFSEHQLQLNTMWRAETFPARFFCQNSPRISADDHLRTFRGDRNSFQHIFSQNSKESGLNWVKLAVASCNFWGPSETTSPKVARGHSKLYSIKARFLWRFGLKNVGRGFCLLGMSAGGRQRLFEDCSDKKNLRKMSLPCKFCSTEAGATN